jgi:DNA-binding response OmpR family regulator
MARHILFVDNDPDFLSTRTEFLEQAGYSVFKATSLSEAEWLLKNANIHLAVIDIRMQDDDDERDESGLAWANQTIYRLIPKIVLTGFPRTDAVRTALKQQMGGFTPAIDFLAKAEGPDALIEAANHAFAQHVRINWDLDIDWKARDRFSLVTLVEPALEGERLLNRAEELEDLFRRLFYEKNYIRIDHLLWQREGRVALTVFAFAEGEAPESSVVICGQNARVVDEARRYKEFAPKAPGDTGTMLSTKAETTHFAANAYALAGADLENVCSFVELYRAGPEKLFNTALTTLFQKTLATWHQEKRIPEASKTLDQLYGERLGLTQERVSSTALDERVQLLCRQVPTLGPKIESASGVLTIRFDGQSFSYLDPTSMLYEMSSIGQPVMLMNTPGTLSGDNVLTDASGRAWLTDFAGAGRAPLLWNFVTLEAAIRFDWVETNNLQRRHEMERCLVTGEFSKLSIHDVEPVVRKPVRAIQAIRRLASRTVGKDPLSYHVGILFHAASRLADFNPAFPLTPNELARLAHALIAAAMICDEIAREKQEATSDAAPDVAGIRIDKANHAVWVGSRRIQLRGQGYDLLCYLYEHADQLCTRRQIVERVLKEKYDEKDGSQIGRLNTAIRRLREKIENDPNQPRHLLTEPGGGYRLVPYPQK